MIQRAPGPTTGGPILRDASFVTALVVAVVVALGFGLVVPVLPLLAETFGVSVFAVSLVVSVFAAVRLVSNLYAGPLSDRIGSRRAVGYGAITVGGSSLLIAVAPGYWWLVVARGLGGFGSALFFIALLSLVIRVVGASRRARAVGMLQGAFLFGLTVGPLVGGALAGPLGLRGPFVVYAVACTAAGLVALLFLPRVPAGPSAPGLPAPLAEDALGAPSAPASSAPAPSAAPSAGPSARRGLRGTWDTARRLCADRAFVAALVMMAASRWSATGVRFSLVPLFGQSVGASVQVVSVGLGIAAVTQLAVLWPVGRASDTIGRRTVSAPAYVAFALAAGALGLATGVTSFLVLMALYGIGTGLTSVTPPAVVADVVPAEDTGVGVGVLNTAGDLGSVLGPLVSGLVVDLAGYRWGFGSAALFLLVGAWFAVRMRETLPAAAPAT